MYKFSKFSKFISACFSFGILFSGLQTYGMNLTKPSVLDGIKVELPDKCKFCSQKVLRVVAVPNGRDIYICRDNDCLKKIFDKFNIKLNTENIHRCDWFKTNMQKFQAAKAEGLGDVYPYKWWKIFDEDKLINERFLPCGHSICRCQNCIYSVQVCPTCNAVGYGGISVSEIGVTNRPAYRTRLKIIKLLSEKLKNEWKNIIFLSDEPYNNVDDIADEICPLFMNQCDFSSGIGIFNESIFNKVSDELIRGKILVLDTMHKFKCIVTTGFFMTDVRDSLTFIEKTELYNYIGSLKECGKEKMIVCSTSGDLCKKINDAIKMSGNTKLKGVFVKMQEDGVEK